MFLSWIRRISPTTKLTTPFFSTRYSRSSPFSRLVKDIDTNIKITININKEDSEQARRRRRNYVTEVWTNTTSSANTKPNRNQSWRLKMGSDLKKMSSDTRKVYEKYGQDHVFKFLDKGKLSDKEEDVFAKQLEEINVERTMELFKGSTAPVEETEEDKKISAIDSKEVASVDKVKENRAAWSETAYKAMSKGEVCFIILSGGQGTRLGFSRAKGMYDIKLPSHKTLFELQGQRLLKLHEIVKAKYPEAAKAGTVRIPWYIMTSPLNDEDTRGFFKENKFFGLKEEDVFFFAQGTLPCMTNEGKFILENKSKVAFAPDGNGGIYQSMENKGAIKDMEKRGVKYIHVSSVDNAIVQVADPAFVGFCIDKEATVGNKGCPKVSWDEKVGVMAKRGGKYCIVEYSELDEESAKKTDQDGKLLFSTGNICNHFLTVDFIRDVVLGNLQACYHVARKKIPCADGESGETVKPTENNGIKLEMFIFDVFPLSQNMAVYECDRSEEFSPVKNAPGSPSDSPDTAREMIFKLHKKWLVAAGAKLSGDASECEITPKVSMLGEGLGPIVSAVPEFKLPLLIRKKGESSAGPSAPSASMSTMKDGSLSVHHATTSEGLNIYEVETN